MYGDPFPLQQWPGEGGSRYFVVLGMIFLTTLGFISWKIVLKFLPSENAQEYRQRDFLDILKHYGNISHTLFSSISQQLDALKVNFIISYKPSGHSLL